VIVCAVSAVTTIISSSPSVPAAFSARSRARGADLQQRLESARHARQVDRQAPGAQVQLEQLPEIGFVLDHEHLEGAARRAPPGHALATLQQLVDRGRQDATVAARRFPRAQQAGLGPQLYRAQRHAEAIGRLARRTDIPAQVHFQPLPVTVSPAGMTASRAAECNVKLSGPRAGDSP
jgi:hypothetical protein